MAITQEIAVEVQRVLNRVAAKYPSLTVVELMACLDAVGNFFAKTFKQVLKG